ncbi:MAG: glycosyltransferase family 39 protein, partial [Terriglobia bacterium]
MKEPTPIPLAGNELPVKVAAVALLGLMAALLVSSAWNDTLTSDEAAHIGAGYSYLRMADYRMNPEHPPLVKDLASLPLLAMELQVDWNHKSWVEDPFGQWDFGQRLIFNSGQDPDTITRAAKAPMIVFTVALGWAIFWWTRRQFGDTVALLSLFFYAFSPTFLAHGRL